MSSSKSLASCHFSGVRVAGELQYIPGSVRPTDGKEIQARCVIPIFINTGRNDGGGNSISHTARLTAWGKLADVCAKSLPKGKELHITAEPRSYKGQVFYKDGSPVIDQDGAVLKVNKLSFNIQSISFGADSADFIQKELAAGRRLPQWNVAGTPDHAAWLQRIEQVKGVQYVPGQPMFGYAKVLAPNTYAAAPVTNAAGNPGAVNQALPAGYVVGADGNVVMANAAPVQAAQASAVPLF